ncbi:MAG: aspartyl protease family protein [Nitrososphaerales archaeon]|nr:aspartyl protease family protein [Nitrososphaerales archaeon]
MGTFSVATIVFRVGRPEHSRKLALVADTGATYTTLPGSILKELGVKAVRTHRLRLADGSVVEREMGEVALDLGEGHSVSSTPVVFGSEEVFLLGSVTLEQLSLAVDPENKRLVPGEGLLLSVQGL